MATIDIEDVNDYAGSFDQNFDEGRGLLLTGPPGVGKSWALAALVRYFLQRAKKRALSTDYIFITAPQFFDLIGVVEPEHDSHRSCDYVRSFSTTPVLVVNDLGKEYRGGKLAEQIPHKLGRILRARSENVLPTFISTNMDTDALRANYGESIMSLMRENMTAVVVGGADRRGQR